MKFAIAIILLATLFIEAQSVEIVDAAFKKLGTYGE